MVSLLASCEDKSLPIVMVNVESEISADAKVDCKMKYFDDDNVVVKK